MEGDEAGEKEASSAMMGRMSQCEILNGRATPLQTQSEHETSHFSQPSDSAEMEGCDEVK